MEINVLKKALQKNVGDVTFYEAYERTGKILNITVSPANDYERPRLLNYLTSPNVLIWSAACASCAFPILYQPVELVAKSEVLPQCTESTPPPPLPLCCPLMNYIVDDPIHNSARA